MEEVQNIKRAISQYLERHNCNVPDDIVCGRQLDLIDTIEALQQEIEQREKAINNIKVYLYDKEKEIEQHIKWNEEHTKARTEQMKEIKQLQAQAAAMREVILAMKPSCGTCNPENCTSDCENLKRFEMIDAALALDAGRDYHNPADVEALETAKTALMQAECHCRNNYHCWRCRALIAIEKALGSDAYCLSK